MNILFASIVLATILVQHFIIRKYKQTVVALEDSFWVFTKATAEGRAEVIADYSKTSGEAYRVVIYADKDQVPIPSRQDS